MDSADLPRSTADRAPFSDMWASPSSYKDEGFLVSLSSAPRPPALSSPTITSADGHGHHLSDLQQVSSSSTWLHPFPTPAQVSTSCLPPSPFHTSSHRSGSLGHCHWTSVLPTPPPSTKGSKRNSPRSERQYTSTPYRRPLAGHHRFERNTVWPESPTLSTRRARKFSQLDLGLASLCVAADQAFSDSASCTMSSGPRRPSQSRQSRDSAAQVSSRMEAQAADSHRMLPPFKPRALTLDGADRPSLPPMLGYTSAIQKLGPIRNTSSSSLRHRTEPRSNPYFISTPTRRSVDDTRSVPSSVSPQTSRDGSEAEAWSPFQ